MSCRIADLRNKQVVCIKSGCVLGYISDVEFNTSDGTLTAVIIFGRPKLFGLLGHEDDIIIPWREIEVFGPETILVTTEAEPYAAKTRKKRKNLFD